MALFGHHVMLFLSFFVELAREILWTTRWVFHKNSRRLPYRYTCSQFFVDSRLLINLLFWLFHVLVVHLFSYLVSILGLYSFYFHSSSSFFSKKESYHIRYCLPARCTYYAHLIYNCTENYEYLYVPVLHVFWDLLIFYLCRLELMF